MKKKEKSIRKIHLYIMYLLLPVLSLVNLIAPFVNRYVFNKWLGGIQGYSGHLSKISFPSFGKKIVINGFHLDKKNHQTGIQTRFFSAEVVTLTLNRRALLKGIFIADLSVDSLSLTYLKEVSMPERVTGSESAINVAFPIVFTEMRLNKSCAEYLDPEASPIVDLIVKNMSIVARNISNVPNPGIELPAEVRINGNVFGGLLNANVHADVSSLEPKFDLNAELRNMDLVKLNNFFRAYGHFDVNKGSLSLFAEVAAKSNKFKGYVKPEVFDLDVVGPEDKNKSFLNKLWQDMLGATAEIFENHRKNEIATKIPFSGTFKAPAINLVYAITHVLSNAFIHALKPSIDYEIDINSVSKK